MVLLPNLVPSFDRMTFIKGGIILPRKGLVQGASRDFAFRKSRFDGPALMNFLG
jgi:hypothetical protein